MIANSYKILIIILVVLFSSPIFGQNIEFSRKFFKRKKEDLKLAQKNIKNGDSFWEKGMEKVLLMQDGLISFENALFYYQKAQDFNPDNALLNYKIGTSLLFTNKKEYAFSYLQKAFNLNDGLPYNARFYFAMSLHLNQKYEEAIQQFEKFKKLTKSKKYTPYARLTKKYIKACIRNSQQDNENKRIWVDNLSINSPYDDWSPCLSADGDLLIFTSNRPNKNKPSQIGMYDQDIYYSYKEKRDFLEPKSLLELNTEFNDFSGGLSYDGQRLLIFKEEDGNADIFESILIGEKWGNPKRKMGKKLSVPNTEKNERFASYEPPDIKVYYVTDGGHDENNNIYFSGVMNKDRNIWGKGQSVGHEVNTDFQEGSVYIHPDGKSMYFSSQGHNSMGGFDIFVSYLDELGHWGKPINLGFPINTPYDDLFYSETASGTFAYIASNRPGGKGGLDIYKITYWIPKPMTSDFEDQLIGSIANPIRDNTIAEPIKVEEKSLTIFKGKVIDAVTRDPIRSDITITLNSTAKEYITCHSNSATGKFLLSLPSGNNYGISVDAEGYLFHSENFDLPKDDGFNMVVKDIELQNIKVGNSIALRNVFFDTDKSQIKEDSYPELKRLVDLLIDIPSLKIEISGHTDNIGNKVYNQILSEKRAKSVFNYLVSQKVDRTRLIYKGYGESKPIDNNETLDGRSQNRRTEFKILEN